VALVIAGLVSGVRLAWVFTVPYVVRALDRRPEQRTRRVGWRERLVSGWSGMRGAVSLAAALSLPQQAAAGVPFPEEVLARRSAAEAAIARIDELAADDWARPDTLERLRGQYEFRRRRFAVRAGDEPDDGVGDRSLAYQRVVREVLDAQRRTLVDLRTRGVISNEALRRVERDLDLEDSRLEI